MKQPGPFADVLRSRILSRASILCFAFVVACGGAAKDANSPADAPKDGAQTGGLGLVGTAPDEAGVTVLTPGDEPRTPMRYSFHVGQREQMKMDMKMSMGMSAEGAKMAPMTLPTVRMIMVIDPKGLTPDGDLQYEFKLTDVAVLDDAPVPPQVAEKLRAEMKKLPGLGGSGVVTSRGVTKSATITPPPNANPAMLETLENLKSAMKDLVPPLPREPIGKGARWKSIANLDMRAMHVTRTVTYTLTARDGDKGTLQSNVELTAPQQELKSGQLPPNAKMTLDSLTASGSGTVDFDLQKLTPKSQVDIDTLAATTVEMNGQKSPLMLSTKMAILTGPSASSARGGVTSGKAGQPAKAAAPK